MSFLVMDRFTPAGIVWRSIGSTAFLKITNAFDGLLLKKKKCFPVLVFCSYSICVMYECTGIMKRRGGLFSLMFDNKSSALV